MKPRNDSLPWLVIACMLGIGRLTTSLAFASPVSFYNDLLPILERSCTGCHYPAKRKAQLDLTSFRSLQKGGKSGPSFVAGNAIDSLLIREISGDQPEMPAKGAPLTGEEVGLFERWIMAGGLDDSPEDTGLKPVEPPVYRVLPVISALRYSPDGRWLAISGYHEVLLHRSDGSGLVHRFLGESRRIESLAFSPDSKRLAVAGGSPSKFGEVQLWDIEQGRLLFAQKISYDCLYGISFSPLGDRLAVGGADHSVRVLDSVNGHERLRFDNHRDWVLGTAFSVDGRRLLSGSRDRALKLIHAESGQFIDNVNGLLEEVLCLARHPHRDEIVYGGFKGNVRIYRISDNQQRTESNNDVNLLLQFDRQDGPVRAVAYNSSGTQLAIASGDQGNVSVYDAKKALPIVSLKGSQGPVFDLSFHPHRSEIATGGYDGRVRLYHSDSGKLIKGFAPVPLLSRSTVARSGR